MRNPDPWKALTHNFAATLQVLTAHEYLHEYLIISRRDTNVFVQFIGDRAEGWRAEAGSYT